jgi:hypothetical protein
VAYPSSSRTQSCAKSTKDQEVANNQEATGILTFRSFSRIPGVMWDNGRGRVLCRKLVRSPFSPDLYHEIDQHMRLVRENGTFMQNEISTWSWS